MIFSDGTIVTGNSLGDTEFWDSTVGVQVQSIRTHSQDITSIASDEVLIRILFVFYIFEEKKK